MSRFNPLLWHKLPAIWSYGVAVLSVAAVLVVARWPLLHLQGAPVSLFLCAVMLSAWLGGVWPGLLTTFLSVLAFYYGFLPPIYSFEAKPAEMARFVLFTVSALFVGSLSVAQSSATESLRHARDDLKLKISELQQTNDALQCESWERMQVENRLRRSEAYLSEAQRLTHTGSFGWNVQNGGIRWSDETLRIFEYEAGTKPTLEAILQRVHPEDIPLVKETIERASHGQKDFDIEHRLVMLDGSIKYVRVVGHVLRDESGETEFVGALTDITAAKEAEDRIRLIIDTVPAQLWTETPEGVVNFVSRRWVDYTGMTLEQAVGHGWTRIVHPDDIDRVLSKWRTLITEGKPREIESRLRRFDGEYRWFLSRCCPLVGRAGRILGWYGSDADIHDRKEAEEALQRSEGYLAEAQRLSKTGSWARDPIGDKILYWSAEMFRIFGVDPQQGVPCSERFAQLVHPEDRDTLSEHVQKSISAKTDYLVHHRIVLPDGTVKHVEAIGHPVLNAGGEVVECVGTAMDVTDRKHAEAERERVHQLEADLARVNRITTMGELTASLAHEVNQPIGAAVINANTCIRWLAGDNPNIEEARAAALRSVKDGRRAAEIIGRIRLLFKKGTAERELVNINEVIREMIVLLHGETTRYQISVETDLAQDLSPVTADRVQLQQVMMNLMMNSIDAMKDVEGNHTLAIKSQRGDDEQILITVSDTGVGLPQEQKDQIFNAFFTTKSHGTGMGLSISRSIVESHGGRLWATGNTPRGASFCLTLPANIEAD